MGSQLTDLIRKKYPGHYEDMSDEDLESAVLAKHPEYKDLASKPVESPSPKVDEPKVNEPKVDTTESKVDTPNFKTEVSASKDEPKEGWMSRGYHALTDPLTDAPSRFGKSISDYITTPKLDDSRAMAMTKGAIGGGLEGLGNVISGLTSPLSLATMGMAGAEGVAGKAGLESIAQLMNTGQKVAALPMIGHGGYEALRPDSSLSERGMGLAELAGGMAAGMHSPTGETGRPVATLPETMRPEVLSEMHDAVIPHDLVPVGDEAKYNGQFMNERRPSMEDVQYDIAREKQGMGKDIPDSGVPMDINVPPSERVKTGDVVNEGAPPIADEKGAITYQNGKPGGITVEPLEDGNYGVTRNDTGAYQTLRPEDVNFIKDTDARLRKMNDEKMGSTVPDLVSISNDKGPSDFSTNDAWDRGGPSTTEFRNGNANAIDITPEKPKGVLGNNVNIILKSEKATPETIKKAMEAGYELIGTNDNGDFRFKKADKPVDTPILESELPSGKRLPLGPKTDEKPDRSALGEISNFSRSMMATIDMSAPLRQGIGLVHKPGFWKALVPMIKSFGSEKVFQAAMDDIASRPLFKSGEDNAGNHIPSFAEKAGLQLTDLGDVSTREEAMMSKLAEKWIPGVRNSERAYTIFLNKLRADTFESLVKDGKVLGQDGETNIPLAKSLADFVNTATGRGSLGKLEGAANVLNQTFFAPRLIASRLHLMDPRNYVTGNPQVRQEYLKSLLAIVGAGNAVGQVAKLAGAEVSSEPTSADFGKIKIGKIRLDPFAGFQQYAVLASRLLSNQTTSSTTGKSYELGQKFGRQTRFDVAERFVESKLSPMLGLATAFLHGRDFAGNKFNPSEEVAQRFVPLFIQDLKNLLTEDPNITSGYPKEIGGSKELHPENLPLALPGWFGMGTQLYGDRSKSSRQ